jgi:hypothetical protein
MSSVPFNISPSDWLFLPTEDPPLELLGNTSIHRSKFYGKEGSSANLSRVLRTCRGADTNRRLNGLGLRGDARDSPRQTSTEPDCGRVVANPEVSAIQKLLPGKTDLMVRARA